jgi:ABC-type amino acid transport substrate-binding protein
MEITASMVLAIRLLAAICALFAWGLLLSACGRLPPPEQSGELVVGIREAPGFYQREDGDESGFEHDLVRAFATKLGLKLRLVIAKDTLELAALAKQNQIHMAVAMPMGNADLEWSQPIRKIAHVIVGLADELGPSGGGLARTLGARAGRRPAWRRSARLANTATNHRGARSERDGIA